MKAIFSGLAWLIVLVLASIAPQSSNAQAPKEKSLRQATFPTSLVGAWCSIAYEGERLDISNSFHEEGDGICKVRSVRERQWSGKAYYDMSLVCDMGVEGKKPFAATEKYSVFPIANVPHMIRLGSLFDRNVMNLYKRCD